MARNSFDKHHIIPRSRGGKDKGINITPLEQRRHRALHLLFENQTPDERILQVLEWDSPVLIQPTVDEIVGLIEKVIDKGDFYNPKAFKK